jgi:hypothetical protein
VNQSSTAGVLGNAASINGWPNALYQISIICGMSSGVASERVKAIVVRGLESELLNTRVSN